MYFLHPSMLASDYSRLGEEIRTIDEAGTPYIHVDIMDGHFVPNISFGPPVLQCCAGPRGLFGCAFEISQPERYVDAFLKAGADLLNSTSKRKGRWVV